VIDDIPLILDKRLKEIIESISMDPLCKSNYLSSSISHDDNDAVDASV
jgi:hypothetical protein